MYIIANATVYILLLLLMVAKNMIVSGYLHLLL